LAVDFAHCPIYALGQVPRQKAWSDEGDESKYEETDNDGDPPSTLRAISHPGSCTHRQKKRDAIKYSAPPRRHGIHSFTCYLPLLAPKAGNRLSANRAAGSPMLPLANLYFMVFKP
jgi:hypothetical protein